MKLMLLVKRSFNAAELIAKVFKRPEAGICVNPKAV
jgi:hypothetical protein